ncbi:MAG: GTPase [Pirellulaceae bacterium]
MKSGQLELRSDPPVVCQLTAAGRGAICVLAISAPDIATSVGKYLRPVNGRPLSNQSRMTPVYAHWHDEDVIVCLRDDNYLEVHCHGGQFASRRIIGDLQNAGFEHLSVQEATRIANTAQAAMLEIGKALTRKTAMMMNWQVQGALDRQIKALRNLIRDNNKSAAGQLVQHLLQWQRLGLHLTRPWKVVVAGAPNVGKSSLINRILGYQRSIVYDMPGTTRDLVTAQTAIDGWPVEFVDTAGLRVSSDEIEKAGVALARAAIDNADLTLELLDASQLKTLPANEADTIRVFNKCDLQMPDATLQGECVSALTGQGIEELLDKIALALVPEEPAEPAGIPFLQEQLDCLYHCLKCLRDDNTAAALESLSAMGV